jgi:hypothetical protein
MIDVSTLPTELIRAYTLPICTGSCGLPLDDYDACRVCGRCHEGCCSCIEDATADGIVEEVLEICALCDSLAEEAGAP